MNTKNIKILDNSKKETEKKYTLSIYDEDNNLLVGTTKDEVMIYAAGMQRENPDILFFELNEIFTINGGCVWVAVPVKKTHEGQELKLIPEDVLHKIVNEINAERESKNN